jgi:hypothetical protein
MAQRSNPVLYRRTPSSSVNAEEIEFFGPVPDADHVAHSSTADEVDHGHVLGQLHRLIEGQQESGHADVEGVRARRDGGGQRQW